jgi:hypothetical protein
MPCRVLSGVALDLAAVAIAQSIKLVNCVTEKRFGALGFNESDRLPGWRGLCFTKQQMSKLIHQELRGDREANQLTVRARRFLRKGESRKAMLALREAVALDPSAVRFTQLGVLLGKVGRPREAIDAFKQALFLFRSSGARGKARTVAHLILVLDPAEPSAQRAAA